MTPRKSTNQRVSHMSPRVETPERPRLSNSLSPARASLTHISDSHHILGSLIARFVTAEMIRGVLTGRFESNETLDLNRTSSHVDSKNTHDLVASPQRKYQEGRTASSSRENIQQRGDSTSKLQTETRSISPSRRDKSPAKNVTSRGTGPPDKSHSPTRRPKRGRKASTPTPQGLRRSARKVLPRKLTTQPHPGRKVDASPVSPKKAIKKKSAIARAAPKRSARP
jgi:hypothetical protein